MSEDLLTIKDYAFSQKEFSLKPTYWEGVYKTFPVPENIKYYYDFPEYHSHQKKSKNIFSKLFKIFKRINLYYKKSITKQFIKNGKLLEYGSGDGSFAKVMSKDFEVYAYEPFLDISEKKEFKKIRTLNDFENETFDVICLWHVLEHIEELESVIKKFHDLLKTEGYIIIALPNYESWDAKHYKNFWAAWDVPRHLWHFNEIGIHKVMKQFLHQKTLPLWFDAIYICMLSEKYKQNIIWFIKGMIIGMYSNLKALFDKNYSSKIYIYQKAK